MTDDQIAFSIAELKEYGVVDSGDTLKLGIGAMTDARWKDFFDKMVKIGMVKADTDYKKAYTLAVRQQGRRRRSAAQMIEWRGDQEVGSSLALARLNDIGQSAANPIQPGDEVARHLVPVRLVEASRVGRPGRSLS